MKPRKLYYRKKKNKIILEGQRLKKTEYICTIPNPIKLINSSLFTREKAAKMMQKILRLDYKDGKPSDLDSKVPTSIIKRTQEKDERGGNNEGKNKI